MSAAPLRPQQLAKHEHVTPRWPRAQESTPDNEHDLLTRAANAATDVGKELGKGGGGVLRAYSHMWSPDLESRRGSCVGTWACVKGADPFRTH